MVRAAKAAMRLNLSQSSSHAPESPEMSMSEGEPLLGAYSRATSPSTYTPPPLRRPGAFSTPSSPSPLGVRHFSSGHSVPNSPVPPPSPAFSSGGFFDTPTAPVAAVARGRRFRFAALAGVGVIAIIGFASLGAADPDRLQRHVVDPMKDALHAAGEAASQGYDQVKGWTGWQAPPDSPDEDWSKDITVTPVEGDRPIVDEDVPAQEAPKVEVIAETDEAQKEATPTDADAALLATPSEAIEPSSTSSEEPIPIAIPTSFHSVDPVPQQEAPIEDESAVVPLYVLPDPPRLPRGGPDEKFFAYLPHSGFHNQRIELANAMTLAWMLNRCAAGLR